MSVEPVVVTVRDACAMLSLSQSRVYELIGEGALVAHKMGRARRVSVASIRRYLADTATVPSSMARPTSRPKRRAA